MICPNCKKEQSITEHNHGALFTCPSCQAVYFINFDGQPEYGEISNEVPVDDPYVAPAEPVQLFDQSAADSEQSFADIPEATVLQSVPSAFSNIAQEISDFGNTDSQLASMNYDVVISGIDNQQTKSLFKEAIEDSKFAWDAFEIMKSVKNGRVEINKLSPAKAYLLAKRLQFLDLEKKWKQNVLS